jgi:hypothetical protein
MQRMPREVGAAITLAVIKSAALIPILENYGVKINNRIFLTFFFTQFPISTKKTKKNSSTEKNSRKKIEINKKQNNNICNYENIKGILTTNIMNKKSCKQQKY